MQVAAKHRNRPGTVRIVGGKWRRTVLNVLDETGLRPTPSRVRETLFNWLTHAFGGLDGRSALDLFAGSGALGFEAASRGASPVLLIDDNARVLAELRALQTRLSAAAVEIIAGDAARVAERLRHAGRGFDVVFLDPPFGLDLPAALLPTAASLCVPHGFVYVESARGLEEHEVAAANLSIYRADKAGGVFYHLLQRKKID